MKRFLVAGLAAMVVTVAAPSARADDVAIAEKLFLEGKRLMEEGSYPAACEKFKAAHDLDSGATGTLLNLALCHEQIKKNATAWAEFRQVIAESSGKRADRITLAHAHETKLAPLLSFIIIKVPAAHPSGLRVEIDKGGSIAEPSWGLELPTDPGPHSINVTAPGKTTRSLDIVVGDVGDRQTVEIPALPDAPVAAVVAPPPSSPSVAATEHSGRRTVGYALGGIGLAAISAGAVFGILAMGKSSDADDAAMKKCPGGQCTSAEAKLEVTDQIDDATLFANVSNIAIGVGVVALAAGVVLVLTSKSDAKASALGTMLRPTANGAAFSFGRTW